MSEIVQERPSLDEFAAVLAAVDTFGKKLRPREKRLSSDAPRLLAELREAIYRVESVMAP